MQMPTGQATAEAHRSFQSHLLFGACVTKRLWAITDVVDVFEAWEDHSTMSPRVRHWTRLVRRDVHAIYRAARDPRVPWYAKALAICVAGYASPLI
jgi:uncharacterized membrane protein YkvA (DUF1232 family)